VVNSFHMSSINFALKGESKDRYPHLELPRKNGIAERRNISIMDCARTLKIEKNIAIKYWKEAINTAVHTLN
jgi:hypothetical protein